MKIEYVDSLSLKNGFRIGQYESDEEAIKAAGKPGVVCDVINKYLRQKGPLVEARDVFITKLETQSGFKPITRVDKRTNDGKEESVTVWDETEAEYLGRFRKATLAGEFKHPAFPRVAGRRAPETRRHLRHLRHQVRAAQLGLGHWPGS